MPENISNVFPQAEQKSDDTLKTQRALFSNYCDLNELGLNEDEIAKINQMDTTGRNQSEIMSNLTEILDNQEKAGQVWQEYINFLRHKEKVIVQDILKHHEMSGPLVNFLDWDFITEKLHNGSSLRTAQKGEAILDQSSLGSNFFVILDGTVKYTKFNSMGESIKEALNKPFEYFGEQAILNKKITQSTNTVESDKAVLLQIDAPTFREALERGKLKLAERLNNNEIRFPHKVIEQLIQKGELNVYRKNQSITTQTGEQSRFRILFAGQAFVLRNSRRVNNLNEDEFIGDIELFETDRKNAASVISEMDCVVLEIDFADVGEILKNNKSLALRLSQRAYQKELSGRLNNIDTDPTGLYNYDFQRLENTSTPESQTAKKDILRIARETISMLCNNEISANNEEELENLFKFICQSLERQECDDPKHYGSHGSKHTINTLDFSSSIIEGSPTIAKDVEEIFGKQNGEILIRLVALFHDIGYPDLEIKKETHKWRHQEYSAALVKENLSYDTLKGLLRLTQEQYDLFVQAIQHHGSDNPKKVSEGRPFVKTSNSENPLLVIMRLADNLDLIGERLTKLQRDKDFRNILKKIYESCKLIEDDNNLSNDAKRERQSTKMKEIFEEAQRELVPVNEDNSVRIKEISDNISMAIQNNSWQEFLHIQGIAIGQNVFIKEETRTIDGQEKNQLVIYVEYNEPSEEMPLALINWQTGRLLDSINNSISIIGGDQQFLTIEVKQIFPNPK